MSIPEGRLNRDQQAYRENPTDGGVDRRVADLELHSKIDDNQTELEEINSNLALIDAELQTANSSLASIEASSASTATSLDSVETKLDAVNTNLGDIGTKLDAANSSLDDMETAVEKVSNKPVGSIENTKVQIVAENALKAITHRYSSSTTYIGRTPDSSALTSAAVWRIERVIVDGTFTYNDFISNGDFNQIWDNRLSLFPPAAFNNGSSIQFDGVNDNLTIADAASLRLDFNTPFTISFWFKTSNNGVQNIITKQTNNANATGYAVWLETNGRVTFEFRNAGSNRIEITTSTTGFNDGSWHHVVITHSGSGLSTGMTMYVDGTSRAFTTAANTLGGLTTSSTATLYFAVNKTGSGAPFRGNLDEICIWDAEYSAANVTTIYNLGKPTDLASAPNSGSRREWWRMGDGSTFPNIVGVIGGNTAVMTNMTAGDIEGATP